MLASRLGISNLKIIQLSLFKKINGLALIFTFSFLKLFIDIILLFEHPIC